MHISDVWLLKYFKAINFLNEFKDVTCKDFVAAVVVVANDEDNNVVVVSIIDDLKPLEFL